MRLFLDQLRHRLLILMDIYSNTSYSTIQDRKHVVELDGLQWDVSKFSYSDYPLLLTHSDAFSILLAIIVSDEFATAGNLPTITTIYDIMETRINGVRNTINEISALIE